MEKKKSVNADARCIRISEFCIRISTDIYNPETETNDEHKLYINPDKLRLTIDSHGKPILYFHESIKFDLKDHGLTEAYKDCDFITLSKEDAKAVLDIIESVISSDPQERTDVEIFGDKAISFERLYDRLNGLTYKNVYPNEKK